MFKLTITEAKTALQWFNAYEELLMQRGQLNEITAEDKSFSLLLKSFLNEDLTQEQTEEEA